MFINQILTKLKSLVYSKSETDSLLNGKASSSHTHTKSEISDFPAYGSTAGTICQGNDSRLSDARTPTSHTHTKSQITDFPTIPTVNNATLTIQKNGTTVKTFTANASSNVTCNITVPTKVSELSNDSGFLTSHQSLSNYSTLANTVKSLSISGKTITVTPGSGSAYTLTTQDTTYSHPTSSGNKHIPSGGSSGQFLGWSADGTAKWVNNPNTNTWTAMKGATSSANGSVGYVNAVPPKDGYNTKYLRADGTWQVPPDHTYTVNNATLTIQKNGTTVKTFTANASSNVTCNITVPTKTSDLTNNSGFLTSHQSLSSCVQIEEQGDGYIRYSNGLQICWGSLSVAIGTLFQYDPPSSMYYDRGHNFNYPKGFSSIPVVSLCVFTSNAHPFLQVCVESSADNIDKKLSTGSILLSCKCATTIRHETSIHIQAIGRWK